MTAADRLAEIEARIEAATEGPWTVLPDSADWDVPILDAAGSFICCSPDDGVRGGHLAQDAAFIAHARTDVPWLVEQVKVRDKALRAVLALHEVREAKLQSLAEKGIRFCDHCGDIYPCPTVRAITEALDGAR